MSLKFCNNCKSPVFGGAPGNTCPFCFSDTVEFITIELKKTKLTRWQKFCDWFWDLDISYFLSITGLLLVNSIFLHHFKFQIWESLPEAFGLGLAIDRILK